MFRFVVVLTISVLGAAAALAESVSFGAAKDNTLYYDPNRPLSNGAGEYMFVGQTGFGPRRAAIAFDIASHVPAGATITGVTLRLRMSRTISGDAPISLHSFTADWGEGASDAGEPGGNGAPAMAGDVTWFSRSHLVGDAWNTPGGDLLAGASATTIVGGTLGYYTWSSPQMIADVQHWLDHPTENFGWILLGVESSPDDRTAKRFDTHEHVNANFRPKLSIDYIPEPATATMLLGASLLAMSRRRRHGAF